MGIQLDWNIESEKDRRSAHHEDPQHREARRRALVRLLILVVALLLVIALIVFLISQRLQQVEAQIVARLSQTVQAEVAALRIGDQDAYLMRQRSASEAWQRAQLALFYDYQQRMQSSDIVLTGRILDVAVDGPRGRVQVEEIERGAPYVRTWFYWNYDEQRDEQGRVVLPSGWYHVPPDYTFWGEERRLDAGQFTVRYQAVDAPFAEAVMNRLQAWAQYACGVLTCGTLQPIVVDILPTGVEEPRWQEGENWQLVLPSPYAGRARADQPFTTDMQIEVATLLADRLVLHAAGGQPAVYPRDAFYLRSAVVSWLVGRFVQVNTNAFLIESVVQRYGESTVGRLVAELPPDADMNALAALLNVGDVSQAGLDWRDFFTWRLNLEAQLISRGDEANWRALYDLRDEATTAAAYSRYNAPASGGQVVVTGITPQTGADGSAEAVALAYYETENTYREERVLFRLVDNVWRRAN